MPIFAVNGCKLKEKKTQRKQTNNLTEELQKRIEEKVKNFELYMVSGNYHGNGGCGIPVVNDGMDCGSCPTS